MSNVVTVFATKNRLLARAEFTHAEHGDVYVSTIAGEHVIEDSVDYAHVEEDEVLAWLDGEGYERLHREVP